MKLFGASNAYLAPLIFLGYLIVDIRIDSKRLLWLYQRPVPLKVKNIGKKFLIFSWYYHFILLFYGNFKLKGIFKNLINFINLCAIINNGLLVILLSGYFKKSNDKTIQLTFFISFQVRYPHFKL